MLAGLRHTLVRARPSARGVFVGSAVVVGPQDEGASWFLLRPIEARRRNPDG